MTLEQTAEGAMGFIKNISHYGSGSFLKMQPVEITFVLLN
jgi:hypothetical protein